MALSEQEGAGQKLGRGHPEPELKQVGCAGFQYVVSETNSEKIVMLSSNDSPQEKPTATQQFCEGKTETETVRGDLFPSTVVGNRGFPLLAGHPITYYVMR